jgi:hypothetical protein
MRHRNGVHKYEAHFQAGGSIYRHTPESTNIPSYFSDMSIQLGRSLQLRHHS